MKKRKGITRIVLFIIILLLMGIYTSFLSVDIMGGYSYSIYSKALKYCAILLCCAITFMIGDDGHDARSTRLLQLALVFTAVADFFIGIMGMFKAGVMVFLIVQIIHIIRNSAQIKFNKKEIFSAGIIYLTVIAILLFIGVGLAPDVDKSLFIAICVYGMVLGTSLWMAIGTLWRKYFPRLTAVMITIGMTCFFFCDINVGTSFALPREAPLKEKNRLIQFTKTVRIARRLELVQQEKVVVAPHKVEVPFTLRTISSILIWFFYLPAQVLLSLSGYRPEFLKIE